MINIYRKRIIVIVLVILSLLIIWSPALASNGVPDCTLDNNLNNVECKPIRLKAIEETFVRIIYIIWVAGIPIFGLIGIMIGVQYMLSSGDPEKNELLKRKGGYWVLGMVLFFASQPLAASVMGFFINTSTDCFSFADTPGFTFFFDRVCSGTKFDALYGCVAGLDEKCKGYCENSSNTGGNSRIEVGTPVIVGSNAYNLSCQCGTGSIGGENKCYKASLSTNVTALSDGIGGCCNTTAAEGALAGCFSKSTAGPLSIPKEECTNSNGGCSSGLSCTPTQISSAGINFNSINNASCNRSQRGRTLFASPGGVGLAQQGTYTKFICGETSWSKIL